MRWKSHNPDRYLNPSLADSLQIASLPDLTWLQITRLPRTRLNSTRPVVASVGIDRSRFDPLDLGWTRLSSVGLGRAVQSRIVGSGVVGGSRDRFRTVGLRWADQSARLSVALLVTAEIGRVQIVTVGPTSRRDCRWHFW